MEKVLFIVLLLFANKLCYCQISKIHGFVFDSSSNKYLEKASVILMDSDSIILRDTRSLQDGYFTFEQLKSNRKYILFVSYPEYVSFSTRIYLEANSDSSLLIDKIFLKSKTVFLKEVVVTSRLRDIQLRGDTIQYVTTAIKLPPNSSVEDLLKILPGLQIDEKGRITAQGKKIKKVLVDGEEFFGDDPAFAIKNLRSEMVGKVQVFDKKTDAALFTGIDDGVKDRVINLQLKEDKNSGKFGKLELGAGPGFNKSQYASQAMLNSFNKKKKASVYVSSNNTGDLGLASADKNKLGINDNFGSYEGKGIPEFTIAGGHFDNKWNKDRTSINADLFRSIFSISGYDSVYSQSNLPSGIITRTATTHSDKESQNLKANLMFKQILDSSSTLSIGSSGFYSKNNSNEVYSASDINEFANILNNTKVQTSQSADIQKYTVNLTWQRKLKKDGRTIMLSIDNMYNSTNGSQNYISNTDYYNGKPSLDSIRSLDLVKNTDNKLSNIAAQLYYSDRVSKSFSFVLTIKSSFDNVKDNDLSFQSFGSSNILDNRFSTQRDDEKASHTGSLNLNFSKNKLRVSLGGIGGIYGLDINEGISAKSVSRNYSIWKPYTNLQYSVNHNTNISFGYKGSTLNPDLQQVMPYVFNNNQLVTFTNNLNLENSFSHKISFSYESFRNVSQAFTAVVTNYSRFSNPISLNTQVDKSGAYFMQYVNMTGYVNDEFDLTGFYSRPFKKIKTQITFDLSAKNGNSYSYLNSALNKLNYGQYSFGILGSKSKGDKFYASLGGSATYNSTNLTENAKNVHNNFFSFLLKFSSDISIFSRIQFHNEANYFWQQKNQIFRDNFDRLTWNIWISRNFLKSNQLSLKLACNDLLNTNSGISRTSSGASFIESRYVTIRRYFMMTVSWNFTKYKQLKN